jgi:hypothetical protein
VNGVFLMGVQAFFRTERAGIAQFGSGQVLMTKYWFIIYFFKTVYAF